MNALIFLIETFARLYMLAFLLRLLLQVARADFYSPIPQFIVQITNPLVVPARRIVPSVRRFDLPTLVVLVVLQLAVVLIVSGLRGFQVPFNLLLWAVVFSLLELTVWTYLICIFIYVILSWFGQTRFHPVGIFLGQLIEPILRPARRLLPPVSGIDISPLIVGIFLMAALILLQDQQRAVTGGRGPRSTHMVYIVRVDRGRTTMSSHARLGLIAGMALVTGACGQSAPNTAQGNGTDEVMPATESFRVFDNYELHFNALTTDQLNERMATEHSIVRSRNRILLNVSVLRNQEIGVPTAVSAEVQASARNLTGQLRNLPVREIRDGDAIYYIAEMPIANAETLIFTVEAIPESETEALAVSFQKQFFVEDG